MAKVTAKLGWKVIALVASLAANQATRTAAEKIYRAQIGEPPPDPPTSPRVPLRAAVLWAVLSGSIGELIGLLVERAAANAWKQTTGDLPPGLELEEG